MHVKIIHPKNKKQLERELLLILAKRPIKYK